MAHTAAPARSTTVTDFDDHLWTRQGDNTYAREDALAEQAKRNHPFTAAYQGYTLGELCNQYGPLLDAHGQYVDEDMA